jgi:hypothetical protein
MPCCAFAACLVAQLLFGARALKRALLGGDDGLEARNPAVEWRLDAAGAMPVAGARPASPWPWGQRSLRGFALAAALEVLIAVGAIYGMVKHFADHGAHSAHAHGAPREVIP